MLQINRISVFSNLTYLSTTTWTREKLEYTFKIKYGKFNFKIFILINDWKWQNFPFIFLNLEGFCEMIIVYVYMCNFVDLKNFTLLDFFLEILIFFIWVCAVIYMPITTAITTKIQSTSK